VVLAVLVVRKGDRILRQSSSFAVLGMVLNAILTALIVPPTVRLLGLS
jgi:putative effector of murein hydrolase